MAPLATVLLHAALGVQLPRHQASSVLSSGADAPGVSDAGAPAHEGLPLQVHVLAYSRPQSLARLLRSLQKTAYGADQVDLHIHLDAAESPSAQAKVGQVAAIAEQERARWAHGAATVTAAASHLGLRDMWLQAWTPRSPSERGLILEDDLELSPHWYRWLRAAQDQYLGQHGTLAGISLQRLAWSPSGKPLERLQGHAPLLSPTVSTWAFAPDAKHWLDFQRFMRQRSQTAAIVGKFSALDADPGYALQAGWDRQAPDEAKRLWSPAFASYCSKQQLVTLYPSLQPDHQALAVHWRAPGAHYRGKEAADFVLAKEWLPGMSSLPAFEGLTKVPHHGFSLASRAAASRTAVAARSSRSSLALDATQDAMDAYKALEAEAAAKAAASGGDSDTELFSPDAWEWDEERARQLYVPSTSQLALFCAAALNLLLLAVAGGTRAAALARGESAAASDAKEDPAAEPQGAPTAGAIMRALYAVCLPCAELSFWLLWTTLAEFVLPSRARTHAPGDFWELMLLLGFVSLLWQRPVKPAKGAASLLSRDLTNEWRGWMQAAFLMYHYCHMQEVYAFIRLLVTAYVWQTGYGNGMYFTAKREFTGERMFQMLWRLNFLVILLVLATKTPWIAYYVCALHTVHFVLIFTSMAAACNLLYRRRGIEWWPWAALGGLVVFSILVWDVPEAWEHTFGPIFSWLLGADFDRELHFRTFLDHYSSCFGLLAAVMVPLLEGWADRRPVALYLTLFAVALVLAGAWFAVYWETKWDESDVAYDKIHPYISTLPIWLYILFRGATRKMRTTVSVPLVFIGMHSLEFYLLQFHLFLSQEAGAILMIVPNKRLNIALVLPIYVLAAYRTFHLTNVIKDLFFGLTNTYRSTISLYLAVGAFLAGQAANGDLPLWAVWLLGAALFCTPPLVALAIRAAAPQAKRSSAKATVAPLVILAAILVPSQLVIGSALQPLIHHGEAENRQDNISTDDAPAWTESVVDGRCTMNTLPASWLFDASYVDACPGQDASALDGWRDAASHNLEQLVQTSQAAHREFAFFSLSDGASPSPSPSAVSLSGTVSLLDSAIPSPSPSPNPSPSPSPIATEQFDQGDVSVKEQANVSVNVSGASPSPSPSPTGNATHGDEQMVVFWGDSTVRFQFKFWVELIGSEYTELTDFSMTTMEANLTGGDRPAPPDPTQLFVWHATGKLGDRPLSVLFIGSGILVPVEKAPAVLAQLDLPPYELGLSKRAAMVLVGSAGLHHLHLEPVHEWEHADAWRGLETRLAKGLDGVEKLLPLAKLMYFTIHSMCDELLKEEGWADQAQKYSLGAGNCTGERCLEATFSRKGAVHWYQREMSVLRTPDRAKKWGVVDAFKMTEGQCWATADGRHFNPIVPQFVMSAFAQMRSTRVI